MAVVVYTLCTVTALLCALLLTRAYKRSGFRLLLWSALCFWGLSIANALVFFDMLIFPMMNLYPLRLAVNFTSISVLMFGLIWESR